MKKWWTLYLAQSWDKHLLWGAGALALVPILYLTLTHPPDRGEPGPAFDTYIPPGYVLIPIEADNFEALDSILGKFGWVDLFQAGPEGARKVVARNVRLLRAPLNPSHFAVLVPAPESSRLLRSGGVFTVVLRRPGGAGTEFVKSPSEPKPALPRRITYGGE